ncbi:3-carboxy-cis,cis-muconate cycloisomerase [Solwaraspora sp. WMMB335]|uniref:3-carboxy-cis,cis-muconate cycloisomerase n=1 Tax=Solwaraspora sp. WMMB335 TaxID=3404118 RepID=UPI003B927B92
MRPSSSPSDRPDSSDVGLFDSLLAAGGVRAAVDDHAWIRAMLDVQAALARAQARIGAVPADAAAAITAACREHRFDPVVIGAEATAAGNPVVPLVAALRRAVGTSAASHVHAGATSQDILDSATMLVAGRALEPLRQDINRAAAAAARLAHAHADTLMPARTLLQQALPTTFGLVAAGWLVALDATAGRLATIRDRVLAVQLGGAAGTLAAFGPDGLRLVQLVATELGLTAPTLPWHTDRTRIAELAGALGSTAGSTAKIARDVTLYTQTEVGELAEGRPGGSSTLPHKRNPIAAITALACASQAPGLVATLLASMAQEHQRAAGAWHAEWRALRALLESTGSAAYWLRTCLDEVRVNAVRMRTNLDLTGGVLLAEQVTGALVERLGRHQAHEIVRRAADDGHDGDRHDGDRHDDDEPAGSFGLADRLAADPQVNAVLSRADIDRLLDPAGYLGAHRELIDRALRAHHGRLLTEGSTD